MESSVPADQIGSDKEDMLRTNANGGLERSRGGRRRVVSRRRCIIVIQTFAELGLKVAALAGGVYDVT